jgi:succinate dehydrogenase hydrophobic anchor subunit
MRRAILVSAILLALLFMGLVLYGIHHGDASYVAENAKAFCFS